MKLGAALSQRAKLAQRLNDLKGRIKANCLVQEGQQATEDPALLISEYSIASADFRDLVEKIALTNAATMVGERTLLALLQDRESLIRMRNLYGTTADSATPSSDRYRYMRSELAHTSTVDVAEMRRLEDSLNTQIAELDSLIQQTNWETDIPD